MTSTNSRFDRNERLFGREGQDLIRQTAVAVFGVGGLGTHVVQQLALLGVGSFLLIDHEELSASNRNRYISAWHDDPIPGSLKVILGKRLVHLIDPTITVKMVSEPFPSEAGVAALQAATHVIGCVDNDGVRFVLNEACLAYDKPYIDLASDVPEPGVYGGRVTTVWNNEGCLHCRAVLDDDEVRRFLSPVSALENEAAVYGIDRGALGEAGPSVVSINGVVASLGVTEFMVGVTGLREPLAHMDYYGHKGMLTRTNPNPASNCYYCRQIKGKGDAADIARYFPVPAEDQATVDC